MSDRHGPWGSAEPEAATPQARRGPLRRPPAPSRQRLRRPVWIGAWALFLLGVVVLVFALNKAYPGALRGRDDWANVLYGLGFAAIVSAALLRTRQVSGGRRMLGYALAWVGICAALALGFAYRDELVGVGHRVQLALGGGAPVRTGPRELAIGEDDQGAFGLVGEVNGQRVRFIVDTGASQTTLAPQDARRLGVDVDRLDFPLSAETANGVGHGALFTADQLKVGPVVLKDVRMDINQAPMSRSLLGMDVLRRLGAVELRGRTLVLKLQDVPR